MVIQSGNVAIKVQVIRWNEFWMKILLTYQANFET